MSCTVFSPRFLESRFFFDFYFISVVFVWVVNYIIIEPVVVLITFEETLGVRILKCNNFLKYTFLSLSTTLETERLY